MARKVTKKEASSIVARISGVTEKDDIFAAGEKVIETMKLAGMSTRAAERMLENARVRSRMT